MPKPRLREPMRTLETQMIETMIAGLHRGRPDLKYPESHSDMMACARALLRMFEVKRRPLAVDLDFAEIVEVKGE